MCFLSKEAKVVFHVDIPSAYIFKILALSGLPMIVESCMSRFKSKFFLYVSHVFTGLFVHLFSMFLPTAALHCGSRLTPSSVSSVWTNFYGRNMPPWPSQIAPSNCTIIYQFSALPKLIGFESIFD